MGGCDLTQQNCLGCGHTTASAAGVQFCPRCGVRLAQVNKLGEGVLPGGQTMRSVGVAYGLWALGLIGLMGIHRFYAG